MDSYFLGVCFSSERWCISSRHNSIPITETLSSKQKYALCVCVCVCRYSLIVAYITLDDSSGNSPSPDDSPDSSVPLNEDVYCV